MAEWNPVVEEWARKTESDWRIVLLLAKEADIEDANLAFKQADLIRAALQQWLHLLGENR